MARVLLFDVDGTLTAPREPMTPGIAFLFRTLCATHPVYLVTGSDRAKLEDQVPGEILSAIEGAFCCSGNEFWVGSRCVDRQDHVFPDELVTFCEELLAASPYPVRCGGHVERRTGTLNLSVVGRRAGAAERRAYNDHDRRSGERDRLVEAIEARFPDYEAHRGGLISVDLSPRGWNKARVVPVVRRRHPGVPVLFYGDNLRPGGNDEPVAQVIRRLGGEHAAIEVTGPDEVARRLRALTFAAFDGRKSRGSTREPGRLSLA